MPDPTPKKKKATIEEAAEAGFVTKVSTGDPKAPQDVQDALDQSEDPGVPQEEVEAAVATLERAWRLPKGAAAIIRKLAPGEPIFILRAQDTTAPAAVERYASYLERNAVELANDQQRDRGERERLADSMTAKADDARKDVARMVAWQAKNPRRVKWPD